MRHRGIVVSLLCSLLVAPLAAAHADEVNVGQHTIFDTRVSGMPTTAEAWRTLRAVSAETEWSTGEVQVTASLQAPAPTGETVAVTWGLGRWSEAGACVAEKSLSATAPQVEGSSVVSTTGVFADLAHDYTCLDVTLTTKGAVTDHMRDGLVNKVAISGAEADLTSDSLGGTFPTRVVAGTPTKALLLVRSHVLPSTRTTVTGSGPVVVDPVTVTDLAVDEIRPVVARLTAPRTGRFAVTFRARDERGDADYDGTTKVKAVPAPGRPDAGRYSNGMGGARFRVDRAGRVSDLVATASTCDDEAGPLRVRLRDVVRLPRTGVTAVAKRVGNGWTAVQLTTLDADRMTGFVVRSTPSCLNVVSFTVHRTR